MLPKVLTVAGLQALYQSGKATPAAVVGAVLDRIEASTDKAIWISLRPREALLREAAGQGDGIEGSGRGVHGRRS
jgi:Asp-tRNA(Asn)/Glu-tRNA(Gln) amidotransferase A subunit family amidase